MFRLYILNTIKIRQIQMHADKSMVPTTWKLGKSLEFCDFFKVWEKPGILMILQQNLVKKTLLTSCEIIIISPAFTINWLTDRPDFLYLKCTRLYWYAYKYEMTFFAPLQEKWPTAEDSDNLEVEYLLEEIKMKDKFVAEHQDTIEGKSNDNCVEVQFMSTL